MKLKIFSTNKLLSAWIISSIYFCAINPINVIRADSSENFECGIQTLRDSSSDSSFVRQYEYPWKSALFKVKKNKAFKFFGAGSLVNKNTILTAAHMMKHKNGNGVIKNPEQFKIVLGLKNLNDANETGREEFSVKKIVVHPNWNISSDNYDGDIAIITLTEDVTFSRYIRPICLPDESIASITTGQTSSWAHYDDTMTFSQIPRRNEIHIFGEQECLRKDIHLASMSWGESFCAGAEGYSFCFGSSGNGFYVQKNGKFYLRGIVSAAVFRECGTPNKAILTDVLLYRHFLEDIPFITGSENVSSETSTTSTTTTTTTTTPTPSTTAASLTTTDHKIYFPKD